MRGFKGKAEAVSLGAMVAGVLMVWQPWSHALFTWGFAVSLAGIAAYNVATRLKDASVPAEPAASGRPGPGISGNGAGE